MGCVVNGPGGGERGGHRYRRRHRRGTDYQAGRSLQEGPESELLDALRYELLHWSEEE